MEIKNENRREDIHAELAVLKAVLDKKGIVKTADIEAEKAARV